MMRTHLSRVALLAACCAAIAPASASAHIQVTPTSVAPDDPVRFTILVPSEHDLPTTKVELQMPKDLFPFSWGDTPGWTRKVVNAPDGSISEVVWTGKSQPDGFVEFSFLAGTPETEGELAFKALQTYSDGETTAWIGDASAEEPAAVVSVSKDAARQNAGGEGAGAAGDAAPTSEPAASDDEDSTEAPASEDDANKNRILALAALALGAISLVLSLSRRPRRDAP